MNKLNLGCYIYPLNDCWNVDIMKKPWVDEVVDLTKLPWPWKRGEWDYVRAYDVVEHLGGLTKFQVFKELARVTKRGGVVHIRVPNVYHPISLACLQHAHTFYYSSFESTFSQPWFNEVKSERTYWTPIGSFTPRKLSRLFQFLSRIGFVQMFSFTLVRKGIDLEVER